MIEEDMVARLQAAAGVTDLLSSPTATYPGEAPDGSTPSYLVYRRLDTSPDDTYDDGTSVHRVSFVIEAHAPSYGEACELAAACKPVLDGWRDDAPSSIMSMTYAGEHDGAGDYDEAQRRRRSFCRELVFLALIRA